ncbi:MAG: uroporphyrinogen decarboxylase family protein [bacterium]|nr:uroporphyrinogen decarboxylase family protein [bacterium]
MSYADGWAALNLEMPRRVPRTEYSAEFHWPLVRAVTGLTVEETSPPNAQARARQAFMKAWRFDLCWSTLINANIFTDLRTRMGHAVYREGGMDFDTRRESPFADLEQVLAFDPRRSWGERDGRALTRAFEDHYRAACRFYPDAVNMTGVYVTCISGLIDIFGWDNLLRALGASPRGLGALVGRYAAWLQQYFDALAAADVPVVMVHDDIVWTSGPFYKADWYREFVFPAYRRYLAPLLESGKKILFTSDGNYTEFLEDVVACGFHGLVMEPTTDMAGFAARHGRTHAFIGNADTRILLSGDRSAIRAEVERCMAVGKECPGFFMAVGNHIPPNTPVDAALYYNEVYEALSRRQGRSAA